MKPLVSILIRTKNRAKCLQEALQSVKKQTHRPLEVIVVNDNGENVEHVVKKILEHTDVRWKYHQNTIPNGRSIAANKAMSLASADYCLFLDDDDLILENHIENLLNTLQKSSPQKNIMGAYSGTQCVTEQNGEIVHVDGRYNEVFDPIKLAYQNYLPIHSVLFKKEAYQKGCRFDKHLDLYEDWNFWLQVIQYGNLKHTAQLSALYRIDESGIGLPNTHLDFQSQWLLFIKHSKKYLNVEQLNHLLFSAKALLVCQTQLTNVQLEKDAQFLSEARLKKQLQALQQHYETLEKQFSTQKEQYKTFQDQRALLEVAHREQAQQLACLKEHNQMLTDELSFIKQSRCWRLTRFVRKISQFTLKEAQPGTPLSYIQAFFSHLLKGQFHQAFQKVWGKLKSVRLKKPLTQEGVDALIEDGIDILATKHTLYIAELIQTSLIKVGKKNVRILNPNTTMFSDNLHFVVCPQMFSKLPGLYIAFQMEQSVSSRWFTKAYFTTLENAYAIMDYSQENIRFLQQQGKLSYKQIFWTPISNINPFKPTLANNVEPAYDVVFYGDVNNPRRQAFIKQIKRQFSVLILSEVFGEALYQKLQQGRVVINIHYYENALLETTRIYECLSLGLNVISEASSDMAQHANLQPYVTFTPVNDINAMCQAIKDQIAQPKKSANLPHDNENFHYYFARMLTATNLLDTRNLQNIPNYLKAEDFSKRIVLTLPETYQRHAYIKQQLPKSVFFTGLRHFDGWIGAAMSFKYLSERALAAQVQTLEVCEDDVLLDSGFERNYAIVKRFLFEELGEANWDIFCGLIADINDNVTVKNVFEYQGIQFIELNKMTSMVFNLYNTRALKKLASWDAANRCINTNTIDRYLEKQSLKIIVTLPYLVGHQPEQTSSIWHFKNSTYDDLIQESIVKLTNKVNAFKANVVEKT
ncbi:MAG: glycosyltransferase family 2 protein [Thiomicrorhabdus sp.]|nr:glycosyltransferase family 2 protein [Thiomicrorhabdus sp.]